MESSALPPVSLLMELNLLYGTKERAEALGGD